MWKGWQWRVGSWYLNYLGLPLESNFRESISGILCWREFKMSEGWKNLALIQAVLSSLLTYLILVGWGRQKDHLISWDMI